MEQNIDSKRNGIEESYSLEKINDTLYYVCLKTESTLDKWELPYRVFAFETGDVNNDGSSDALVGVIKTTRFDPELSKRLFIFKNYKGYVRPLWLGSKMSQPLEDFEFVPGEISKIRTVEIEKSGKYLVADYKWRKFGLEFIEYIEREVDMGVAMRILKN